MRLSLKRRLIGRTLILPRNRKSNMVFRLAYLHLTSAHLKVKVKVVHISTVNISQTRTDKVSVTIALNIMSHVGFRLAFLELILAYSKGRLGRCRYFGLFVSGFLSIRCVFCCHRHLIFDVQFGMVDEVQFTRGRPSADSKYSSRRGCGQLLEVIISVCVDRIDERDA